MAERLLEGLVREGRNHCRSQLTGGPGATPAPRRAAPVYGAVLKVRIQPSSGESIKPRRQMLQTRGVGSGGQAGARLPHHHEERVVSADLSNPLGSTPPGGARNSSPPFEDTASSARTVEYSPDAVTTSS